MKKKETINKPLGEIEHVIVVMFENRSFDNMLGGLYPDNPNFKGVPKGFSNPFTYKGITKPIYAWQANDQNSQIMPFPDPKEDFDDMKEQIDNGQMKGFVNNYIKALEKKKKPVTEESVKQIMQYYDDRFAPITHFLAKKYAVSDQYFGSGPVQTWPNRLFAHCGTPGCNIDKETAYLNNVEYPYYPLIDGQLNYRSIFQMLDERYPDTSSNNWKVYYDGEVPISTLLKYVKDKWNRIEPGGNVIDFKTDKSFYTDFFKDIEKGKLPKYSFIEPRYQERSLKGNVPPNSNHPGSASVIFDNPPINMIHGEKMLSEIYNALVKNIELFKKTLLVVTYDEHGGLFDHVPPPPAISPFRTKVSNFNYDKYGPRIPAIFINPYIKPKTILRPTNSDKYFDHTSIISTLCSQFDLKGHLTPRDANAPVFEGLINEETAELNITELPEIQIPEEKESLNDYSNVSKTALEKEYGTLGYAVYHTAFLADKGKNKIR